MNRSIRRAFTLIELIVVVFIVRIVVIVVLASIQQQRCSCRSHRHNACKGNLKQFGLAMHSYHDAWGCFPPGLVDDDDDPTEALHTGFTLLLPFLDETALYNAYNFRLGAPPGAGDDSAPDAAGARGASVRGWANPANSTVTSKHSKTQDAFAARSETD